MEEVAWGAAPLTKRLQVALMVLVGVQLQKRGLSLLHCYQARSDPAPRRCGLKGQERDGGSTGRVTSPSLHSACGYSFMGVYPHLRAGKDTEP